MTVLQPMSVVEAVRALVANPDAHLLAGGTDLMVEVNHGHRRPPGVIALRKVSELRTWRRDGDVVELGAGLTYTELERGPLAELFPALAQAARTVGSPQIRNAGTLGGNLGTASPAGDTLPVLLALDAEVGLTGPGGTRWLPLASFLTGPKRTARERDELIVAARVPVLHGPQEFLKVGTRNAMVISVCSLAAIADQAGRTVRFALGSVGPVVLRAPEAEAAAAAAVDWDTGTLRPDADAAVIAELVASAARPIDDHRSTAAYRRHAVAVLARRALRRLFPPAHADSIGGVDS